MQPLAALAESVIQAVNEARAAKADENLGVELQSTLRELDEVRARLEALAEVLPELSIESGVLRQLGALAPRLRNLLAEAETDAISAARSETGRRLTTELRSRVGELAEAETAAWNELKNNLRPDAGTDFLRHLGGLSGFGIARELMRDHLTVERARLVGRLPDAATIREAKAARQRFNEGLVELQNLLPETVRGPLERCFRGELRLVDTTDEFLEWVRANNLDDAFTVSAA